MSAESENIYGVLGEFDDTDTLIAAARELTRQGYRHVEAYTPFPVEELSEALEFRKSAMPLLVLIGGLIGCAAGMGLQYWVAVIEYPLNIGGRPAFSLPSFVPVAFETTILCASLFAVLGMLALNGLPRPHHPVFNIPEFAKASRDGYFLFVASRDQKYDGPGVEKLMQDLHARQVWFVPTTP